MSAAHSSMSTREYSAESKIMMSLRRLPNKVSAKNTNVMICSGPWLMMMITIVLMKKNLFQSDHSNALSTNPWERRGVACCLRVKFGAINSKRNEAIR